MHSRLSGNNNDKFERVYACMNKSLSQNKGPSTIAYSILQMMERPDLGLFNRTHNYEEQSL